MTNTTKTTTAIEVKPYAIQYFEFMEKVEDYGLDIDTINIADIRLIRTLRQEAVKQTGLTLDELTMLDLCRRYDIFPIVFKYVKHAAHGQKLKQSGLINQIWD